MLLAFSPILVTPIIVLTTIRHVVSTRRFIGILLVREYPNHYQAPDWSGNHPVQPWPYDVRLCFVRKAYLLLRLTDTAPIAVPDIIYHNRLASKTTGFIEIYNYY